MVERRDDHDPAPLDLLPCISIIVPETTHAASTIIARKFMLL